MQTSTNGLKFIKGWEGLFLHSYDDATEKVVGPGDLVHGTITIGIGHTTSAGLPKVYAGMVITEDEAYKILAVDLKKCEENVTRLVKVPVTQNQFDVLVSFEYNTGALAQSSALKFINEKQMAQAADALLLYNKAGGKVVEGLVNRRAAERKLFLTPDTPTVVQHAPGAAVVVTGAVAASQYPHLALWIVIGSVALAGAVWGIVRHYKTPTVLPVVTTSTPKGTTDVS